MASRRNGGSTGIPFAPAVFRINDGLKQAVMIFVAYPITGHSNKNNPLTEE